MLYYTKNGRRHGRGLHLLLGCLLFIVALRCEAQNLVPNASMEENTACPVTYGFAGFSKPLHWENWTQSPDYFHTCAGTLGDVDTLIGVPQNGFGHQYPWHGDAYLGMYGFGTTGDGVSYREYVGCELLQPLVIGETYYLSFWTNVSGGEDGGGSYWWTRHASNNMGMLFTMEHNIWIENSGPLFTLRNYAHLHSEVIIDDLDEWVQVSGTFTADSAYQYLVLGNFFSNELTDTIQIVPGGSLGSYYFVDGVCVTTDPTGCDFTTGVVYMEASSMRMHPNPATEIIQFQYDGPDVQWKVFDVWGREMSRGITRNGEARLWVGDWATGQYVFVAEIGEKVMRSKFMVIH